MPWNDSICDTKPFFMSFGNFFWHDFFHEIFQLTQIWPFCHEMTLYMILSWFSWLLFFMAFGDFFLNDFFHEIFRHTKICIFMPRNDCIYDIKPFLMTFDDFFDEIFRHTILWLFFNYIFLLTRIWHFCHEMTLYMILSHFSWLLVTFFYMTFFMKFFDPPVTFFSGGQKKSKFFDRLDFHRVSSLSTRDQLMWI